MIWSEQKSVVVYVTFDATWIGKVIMFLYIIETNKKGVAAPRGMPSLDFLVLDDVAVEKFKKSLCRKNSPKVLGSIIFKIQYDKQARRSIPLEDLSGIFKSASRILVTFGMTKGARSVTDVLVDRDLRRPPKKPKIKKSEKPATLVMTEGLEKLAKENRDDLAKEKLGPRKKKRIGGKIKIPPLFEERSRNPE